MTLRAPTDRPGEGGGRRRGRLRVDDSAPEREPVLGPAVEAPGPIPVAAPRLARHSITLSDGHRIGLAVSGRGVPLVVVHGFSAEGFLYAQTLSRLVARGFKVVAIDMAFHGGTQGLPQFGADLGAYSELMARAVAELGIRRAVLAGHSTGGRVVTQLAATHPDQAIAVLLLDAIVGDAWDAMVRWNRLNPLFYAALGTVLALDTASTVPLVRDPLQAVKLVRLVTPTLVGHALQPLRLASGIVSIFRTGPSRPHLEAIGREGVPLFALHGDRDLGIPLCTARSAVDRAGGELVTIRGGSHSWVLKDPETLPAIVDDLLEERLGDAIRNALGSAGAGSVDEIEELLYEPDAPVLALTPELRFEAVPDTHRRPRYRWTRRSRQG